MSNCQVCYHLKYGCGAEPDTYCELDYPCSIAGCKEYKPNLIPDIPEFDATDGAHPAYWRGEEQATRGIVERLRLCLQPGYQKRGHYGDPGLDQLAEDILRIRRSNPEDTAAYIERLEARITVLEYGNCCLRERISKLNKGG